MIPFGFMTDLGLSLSSIVCAVEQPRCFFSSPIDCRVVLVLAEKGGHIPGANGKGKVLKAVVDHLDDLRRPHARTEGNRP